MKSAITILIFTLFINVNVIVGQNGDSTGLRLESFEPCPDEFIHMEREIGRRPSEENYWNGLIRLKKFENLPEANIRIRLSHPAIISVDENEARVHLNKDGYFYIATFEPSENLNFTVLGGQGKPFPNIENVTINELPVCKNPQQIKPTILNRAQLPISSNAIPLENFIPYCGRSQIKHTELIIGGNDTEPGKWPWHVAMYSRSNRNSKDLSYQCGGSIISTKTILTAAHCVVNYNDEVIPVDNLVIIAGQHELNKTENWTQQRNVISIKIGEGFSRLILKNDIAILHLNRDLEFGQFVQRVCLWTDYEPNRSTSKQYAYNLEGIIVGWGTNENDVTSQKLTSSNLQIVSDTDCLLSYATFFQQFIYQNSICAGPITNGTGPCNGDSGGGLVIPIRQVDNKISYFLRGIVSVTVSRNDKKICDPNFYTIFTDVAQFIKWIENND